MTGINYPAGSIIPGSGGAVVPGGTAGNMSSAGAGHDVPAGTNWKAQLAAWQKTGHYGKIGKFLSQQGYKVGKVDGVWDTTLHSAFNAYQRGMDPAQWTVFYNRVHGQPVKAAKSNPAASAAAATTDTGGFNTSIPVPSANGVKLPSIASILGTQAMPYLNPDIYAQTKAGAQYDPLIQQLGTQRKTTAAMIPQIAQAIDAAYNPAIQSQQAAGAANAQAATSAESGLTGMAAKLAASLGGTGGAALAAAAQNQIGNIAGQAQNQSALDTAAGNNIVRDVGQAKARTTNEYEKALQAIDQATTQATGDRANAVASGLVEGAQFRQQLLSAALANRGAEVNQDALAQMSGLQSQAQVLSNMQAYQNLGVQGQQASDAHATTQAQLDALQQQLDGQGKTTFQSLAPNDLTSLDSYLRSGALDANGKLTIPAAQFRSNTLDMLNSMFPNSKNNAQMVNWVNAFVKRYSS